MACLYPIIFVNPFTIVKESTFFEIVAINALIEIGRAYFVISIIIFFSRTCLVFTLDITSLLISGKYVKYFFTNSINSKTFPIVVPKLAIAAKISVFSFFIMLQDISIKTIVKIVFDN